MLAELVLTMAEQAHRSFGASAALDRDLEPAGLRTLLLRGLGISVLTDDRESFDTFASRWSVSGGDGLERRGLSLVARLVELERASLASTLAQAELTRF